MNRLAMQHRLVLLNNRNDLFINCTHCIRPVTTEHINKEMSFACNGNKFNIFLHLFNFNYQNPSWDLNARQSICFFLLHQFTQVQIWMLKYHYFCSKNLRTILLLLRGTCCVGSYPEILSYDMMKTKMYLWIIQMVLNVKLKLFSFKLEEKFHDFFLIAVRSSSK